MEEWLKIAGQFGVPVALLVLLVWKGWPFVVKQIEDAKADRKAEAEKFVETIRARDILMAETQRQTVKALESMTAEIRRLGGRSNHK